MLQRHKDSNKIAFIENQINQEPIVEKKAEEIKVEKEIESDVSRSDNSRGLNSRSGEKSILSAGGSSIKDTGGPRKYVGSETQNSIWGSSVVEKLIATADGGERIKQEKKDLANLRENFQRERLDSMVESLNNTDTRKASSVSSIGELSGGSFRTPSNSMSIFDSTDFQRVPEKTDGEKMVESARTEKAKDESWKTINKTQSPKSVFDKLFENIEKNEE